MYKSIHKPGLSFVFSWPTDLKEHPRRQCTRSCITGICSRTSLVAQWMRIRLPVQGTWVWSLIWEDSTCCLAAKPVYHSEKPVQRQWRPAQKIFFFKRDLLVLTWGFGPVWAWSCVLDPLNGSLQLYMPSMARCQTAASSWGKGQATRPLDVLLLGAPSLPLAVNYFLKENKYLQKRV